MTCPHCGYAGKAIRGLAPRPSKRIAYTCPACFGQVPFCRRDEEDEEVRYDGADDSPFADR